MSPPRVFPLLLVAALLPAIWCASVQAAEDMTPRPQRVFTEKPRIEDYADYNTFLVDIMEYRRQKEAAAAARQAQPPPPAPPAPAADDPNLYFISGPESLEDALARAQRLPHPAYAEPERFGRTTSSSFPMPPMEGEDMASKEIAGQLADLESVSPETYEDDGAQLNAEGTVASKPTNDRQARETKAEEGSDPAYQASCDRKANTLTGSDGRTYTRPEVIEFSLDPGHYTVIRRLDIGVEVIRN